MTPEAANPFLALSFIAGPAILTNASAVMLNGASIRYNLAVTLWRDLQADLHGLKGGGSAAYHEPAVALRLAHHRVVFIVHGLNLLYGAVAGFGFSALVGLAGSLEAPTHFGGWVEAAKLCTVIAASVGLVSLLGAASMFIVESFYTRRLLMMGLPKRDKNDALAQAV